VTQRPEKRRIARFKRLMDQAGMHAFLVTRREDVRYLTGFTGSAGALIVTSGRPCLITDFRYKLQARLETQGVTLLIQKKDFSTALSDAVARREAGRLWFDESALTVQEMKNLKKQGLALAGHSDMVGMLRRNKDGHELANIRLAVERAEKAFRELKQYITPGARERELGLKLENLMREHGARKAAFDTIVASGGNGAMPHALVTDRRIKRGDLVTFDFGAEANGYYSDITRTICVGKPSSRQREIHALVLKAQAAAIGHILPGVSGKAVDDTARDIIRQAGHGEHFGHGTGHGIGLMVHEGPSLSPLSKDRVAADMVFTVEPGVYLPGWGGVRIEDMVLVTESGVEVLTTLPRELESLKSL
jgi:Xaa-Pro aminopeptidase